MNPEEGKIVNHMLACLAALAMVVSSASAQVFSVDDPVFGPDSITVDQDQGLAFLDLTLTRNVDPAVMVQRLAPGGDLEDWRYASATEVTGLLFAIGFVPRPSPITLPQTGYAVGAGQDAIGLLGETTTDGCGGYISDGLADVIVLVGATESVVTISAPSTFPQSRLGHWIVREAPPPPGPTYQGRLTDSGEPVNGLIDVRLQLVDGLNAPISPIVEQTGVGVVDGVFTVEMTFDGDIVSRQDAKIVISARNPSGSGNPFVELPPQVIAPTPRAIRAGSAMIADTATTAEALGDVESFPLALTAGYTNFTGFRAPTFSRRGNLVVLSGRIRDPNNQSFSNAHIATIAPEYAPSEILTFLTLGGNGLYQVVILNTGEMQVRSIPGGSQFPMSSLSLDGIVYTID